ncbi:Uncharacterized protein APZ42_017904 [Daphnia magna]|uniref:Uncharacterized protein n=1 Tax=Daphnia magna TaxID=35525 RepID=A0A164ZDQ9_9CRUS|nr:Uncharacterized protein APZ42_017904 [Daphnia magna]
MGIVSTIVLRFDLTKTEKKRPPADGINYVCFDSGIFFFWEEEE